MKKRLFTGLCTALVTPFLEDRVNYPLLEVLIRRQIAAGAEAIVLCGTTGESATLTLEEKREIFTRGVRAAAGGCKIIAGTGSNNTASAMAQSRMAQECGVDGLLVVTPYYNKATQPGLVKHYAAIAEAVELPILAYNVPTRTGVDISPQTCRELARIPNIAGLKEANTDLSKVSRILADCGEELPVYAGNDDLTVPILSLGGAGVISVVSNVAPREMNSLVLSALAGDYPRAAAWQRRLLPLMELMFCQVNPIPVKAAMALVGYDVGPCRMPLDDLTAENLARLEACLKKLDGTQN